MAEGEVRQYFVRNEKGTVWGPLTLSTIELLIDNGAIQGQLQISEDGIRFAFPGRFPHLRDAFPRELWGDVVAAGATVQVAKAELPQEMLGQRAPGAPAPGMPGTVPMAGPGTMARGAAPMAGPGAIAQAGVPRPGPGAIAQAGVPMAGPGARAAAAPPGATPGNPSGAFRAAPPPGAGPRPPPVMSPTGAAPGAPTAPPASAAPQAPPVMSPSGSHASVASAPAGASEAVPLPPSQGSLDQLSPIVLYGRIAANGHTGLLTLALSDRTLQIHFRKGSPEFVDSSHPEDALGTSLIQARLLTAEQLQQAQGARERFGGDLLAALFGLGILQPANAFTQLSQRALSILYKALLAESGTFTYEPKELPAAKAMPLGNRWAVLSDQIRRLPTVDLKRRLQSVLNLPIMKAGGIVSASELRLTPHEVRVLTVIDGVRSIAQLLADLPQDQDYILRLAFLLKELGAVSFAAVPQRAPEPKAAAPTPPPATAAPKPAAPHPPPAAAPRPTAAPPPPAAAAPRPAAAHPPPAAAAPSKPAAPGLKPAAAPGPAAPASKPAAPPASAPAAATTPASAAGGDDLPALRQTAATMKGQNLFERLGLTAQADGSAVKLAYFKLARLYHPDTLPPGTPLELEKLKAEIFGYIGDAYRTLLDDKSRADYLELLQSGDTGKEEVDVVAILQAEERFKKGTIFMKSRKYAEAVKIFDEAIQLNGAEAEFHAWRAYARFCAAQDKKAVQADVFRELQSATKKNERCAPAYYFMGVIAKSLGDASGALRHFRRTVELQPDHIDAQREIRMATQKK
ncbi:MAG: DnaJ domain-containing protein [Myxococcaceae bacterium]|nr:DnaJ domain-containing protein [Myxococcaceae bacterium]